MNPKKDDNQCITGKSGPNYLKTNFKNKQTNVIVADRPTLFLMLNIFTCLFNASPPNTHVTFISKFECFMSSCLGKFRAKHVKIPHKQFS